MRHFRWQATVDSVLAALQVADPNRLRIEVEDTMRRFEQIVSKSEPSLFQPEETRDYRIREFRANSVAAGDRFNRDRAFGNMCAILYGNKVFPIL